MTRKANNPFAQRMQNMQRSTIREILKIMKRPGMISFAGGLPAPELFPLKEFTASVLDTLQHDGASSLQYDVTEGYPPLKAFMCQWIKNQGLNATEENLFFTNGSQQALDLIGKVFLDPKDSILVEDPTYLGAIQAFNAYQPRYLTAPMDDEGISLSHVERVIKKTRPKMAYVVPTFQNPSGVTMTLKRRQAFLKLMQSRGIPIIEDDPYSHLRFKGSRIPSLYTLARGRGVIYLSTFSKILSPGIRLGYVLAEPSFTDALILAKQAADLQPNSFIQRAVYHYGQKGYLDAHIPLIIASYQKRAEHMLEAMKRYFPSEVQWVEPEGGMFIWCRLPEGRSASRIFKEAVEHNVAYVTGNVFYANGGGENTFRLNFTNSSLEQIETGIQRLGQVLHKALGSRA